jgi:phage-related protein
MPTPRWPIVLYEEQDGTSPVRGFMDAFPLEKRAKLLAIVALLGDKGPALPFPFSSHIRGKLRELRTHYGRDHYRILYAPTRRRGFVLLHAVAKRTRRVNERDIRLAEERLRRWESRQGLPGTPT